MSDSMEVPSNVMPFSGSWNGSDPEAPKRRATVVQVEGRVFSNPNHILLIEPEAVLCEKITGFLRREGFKVTAQAEHPAGGLPDGNYNMVICGETSALDMAEFHDSSGVVEASPAMRVVRQCGAKGLPIIVITDNMRVLSRLNMSHPNLPAIPNAHAILRDLFAADMPQSEVVSSMNLLRENLTHMIESPTTHAMGR